MSNNHTVIIDNIKFEHISDESLQRMLSKNFIYLGMDGNYYNGRMPSKEALELSMASIVESAREEGLARGYEYNLD